MPLLLLQLEEDLVEDSRQKLRGALTFSPSHPVVRCFLSSRIKWQRSTKRSARGTRLSCPLNNPEVDFKVSPTRDSCHHSPSMQNHLEWFTAPLKRGVTSFLSSAL
jgi:hypothetical protein